MSSSSAASFRSIYCDTKMPLSELFDPSPSEEPPIACDLSALDDPEQHSRRAEVLFAEREEMREVGGGYALRYPGTMAYAERVKGYLENQFEAN